MTKYSDTQIQLPEVPKSGILRISVDSSLFGMILEGDFQVHRRTFGDAQNISKKLSSANDGMPLVGGGYALVLQAVYELEEVVDMAPDWWKQVVELQDSGVINHVYNEYSAWMLRPFRYEEIQRENRERGKEDTEKRES